MSLNKRIAVDTMGGDQGSRLCVSASLEFLKRTPQYDVILVGDESQIRFALNQSAWFKAKARHRISILPTSEVVSMSDKPAHALRHKRASSMWVSLEQVKLEHANACVSSGNTGALMAMARSEIGTISGIDRPAISKPIPTDKGTSVMLDLGANIGCTADQLYQFSLMGAAMAHFHGFRKPTVGLLNIGSEATKGTENLKRAAQLMSNDQTYQYQGFIEGDQVFFGDVDVVVCDGFAGNVALKFGEGVVKFVARSLKKEVDQSLSHRLLTWPMSWVLRGWWQKYNPALFNGAVMLGLNQVVVKSHGGADAKSFFHAIQYAAELVDSGMIDQIQKRIAV